MKQSTIAVFALVVLIFFVSCSEDNSATNVVGTLKITSFSPLEANIGMQICITGDGFGKSAADNSVFFGNAKAAIDSVVKNKIYVRVPVYASSGNIKMMVRNETVHSIQAFTLLAEQIDNLMPCTYGSSWVYEKYALNQQNIRTNELATLDSSVIVGNAKVLHRDAYVMSSYSNASGYFKFKDDRFIYNDDKQLYVTSDWFNDLLNIDNPKYGIQFDFEKRWCLLTIPLGCNNITLSAYYPNWVYSKAGDYQGKLEITASKGLYENIQGFEPALKYNYTLTFEANVKVNDENQYVKFERTMNIWYVNDIGAVKIVLESANYKIPNLVDTFLPGYEMILVRSTIK